MFYDGLFVPCARSGLCTEIPTANCLLRVFLYRYGTLKSTPTLEPTSCEVIYRDRTLFSKEFCFFFNLALTLKPIKSEIEMLLLQYLTDAKNLIIMNLRLRFFLRVYS